MNGFIRNILSASIPLILLGANCFSAVPEQTLATIDQVAASADFQPRSAFHHLQSAVPVLADDERIASELADLLIERVAAKGTTGLGRTVLSQNLSLVAGPEQIAILEGWLADDNLASYARIAIGARPAPVAAVPELSALIAQLESADAAARIAACSGLALHYADAAAEHLEAALGDASSAVRSHAANLLAELDAAKLAESLRGLSEELKMHALDVLAFAAASDAAPHVRELIDHESEGVRAAARAALGALGGAEDVPPLIERGEVSALAALLGDEVDTAILHALANETDPTRLATLVAASAERGSDKLVPGLLLAARSTDNDIQNAALRALSRQADESAYNGLALALAETASPAIASLVSSLGQRMSDTDARDEPLFEHGRSPQAAAEGRIAIARALAAFGNGAVTDELRARLESNDPAAREQAARLILMPTPEVRANIGAEARILIVTGLEYPGHPWRRTTPLLVEGISADPRMQVSVSEDPEILSHPMLADYHAILLHYQNHEVPAPRGALENLSSVVNGGRGLVLVHFASGAFIDWDTRTVPKQFERIAGRVWNPSRRGHDPLGTFRVRIVDQEHPVTAGMADFDVFDELYTMLDGDTPIHVLAMATSLVDGEDYALVFTAEPGEGRSLHCALGHDERAFNDETIELYRRGTAWAAGLSPE